MEEFDWENLAEEVGDLGRSEARNLRSQLARLLAHLLKWKLQPTRRTNSWRGSIQGARDEIRELLTESPGLKSRLSELFQKAYRAAVNLARAKTHLDKFLASSPWSFDQAMDDDFWPNSDELSPRKSANRGKNVKKGL